jgi:hypothetical protein
LKINTRHVITLIAIVMLTIITLSCQPGNSSSLSSSFSWQIPTNDQTVYGIVKLTVRINHDDISGVEFYLDVIDGGHLISLSTNAGNSTYYCDWYTQDIVNGDHVLHAVTNFTKGESSQTSITVKLNNQMRTNSIPLSIIKMTPDNDPALPYLNPAFKDYWYDPEPLEGPINTAGAEDSPFITPDGNTFYFWFNGDQTKDVQGQAKDPMTGIYWSKRVNGKWQEPQRLFLQYFDKIGFDGAETVRGNTLWFASIREGNYRSIDMWTANLLDGRWVNWTNAGELLNKIYQIGELHVGVDGNEIYFDSTRTASKGGKDVWITRKVSGQWQEPENIEVVNTDADEGWPFVSDDGTELWFTRATPGPTIYRSLKVNGKWQTPEMVVSNLAGEPTLDAAGNLYFVHHRWDITLNRATEADIYVCYRK